MSLDFEWRAGSRRQRNGKVGRLFATGPTPGSPLLEVTDIGQEEDKNAIYDIQPMPGDDTSPPNSVDAENLNGIAIPVSASAGWSTSPPREKIYPSDVDYDLTIRSTSKDGSRPSDSLELAVSLEYTNPKFHQGESMVVRVSVAKTLVHAEKHSELTLVATQFQEWVDRAWVDITTDVDYTITADAVVDAVLNNPNVGQTAGKATVKADTIDLTLGPFSERARLNLTFQADALYTYQAMSLAADAADIGSCRLLPLWISLPFAPVDHEAGLASLSVNLTADKGTDVLPFRHCEKAYQHLSQQDLMKETTILAVKELEQQQDRNCFHLTWDSLPPHSCGILAWLALPNTSEDDENFGFVDVANELENLNIQKDDERAEAIVKVPTFSDMERLQVPLPGLGPIGSLWRVQLKMPKAQPRQQPMLLFNLTLSDKSASTGRCVGSGNMRERFNELALSRFVKRFESIPALVEAGVLQPDDVWTDVFLAFNDQAPASSAQKITFRVRDAMDNIQGTVHAIRNNLVVSSVDNSFQSMIVQHVKALRSVMPGGLTDFAAGPMTMAQQYGSWKKEAQSFLASTSTDYLERAFIEFDTDGGHNGSQNYQERLEDMCRVCSVVNGVVTGFGSWLNQDCASKVAKLIGSVPAQLALEVPAPGSEGLNQIFRRSFSAWIDVLRKTPPLVVTISAGSAKSLSQTTSIRGRNFNAMEVLAVSLAGEQGTNVQLPKFGPPDVSEEAYTKSVIQGIPSDTELNLYIVSRHQCATQLAEVLDIRVGGPSASATISTRSEDLTGNFIAFEWLKVLSKQTVRNGRQVVFSPLMSTSLATRLEDEISFRFNIASPSGRTSYVGRSKTVASRASIDQDHQPPDPTPPLNLFSKEPFWDFAAARQSVCCFGASDGAFGSSAPAPSRFGGPVSGAFGAPAPSRFGGPVSGAFGAPAPGGFGGPVSVAFGSPAPGAFGTPAPSRFGGPAPSRFGAPAPGMFGSPPPQPTTQRILWSDSMHVPLGSAVQHLLSSIISSKMGKSIQEIAHARQKLVHDPSIVYNCDVCHRTFGPGEDRIHCYDCEDFDMCFDCRDQHTLSSPVAHRIGRIGAKGSQSSTKRSTQEDPLVSSLLGSTPPNNGKHDKVFSAETTTDRTLELCQRRLERFLLSVLNWWPLFRASLSYGDQLPTSISKELADKICYCVEDDKASLQNLIETTTIVIDSLHRAATSGS